MKPKKSISTSERNGIFIRQIKYNLLLIFNRISEMKSTTTKERENAGKIQQKKKEKTLGKEFSTNKRSTTEQT